MHKLPAPRLVLCTLALAAVSAPAWSAHAQEDSGPVSDLTTAPDGDPMPSRNVGVGAIVGDPTALDLKLRFDTMNAVQVRAGWSFADPYRDRFVLMSDYVLHFPILYSETKEAGLLTPYVGVGGKLGLSEEPNPVTVGVRAPLGVAFMIAALPLEVFLEVVPGVHVVPDVDVLVDAGVGARVYF